MRKIIYTRPDGGLSVVHPVRNSLGETLTTDAEIEQRAWNKLPHDAINPRFVEANEIPADRNFRNAWEDSGGGVTVNMPKAREIHRNQLRGIRKPILEKLDVDYLRADERNDIAEKAAITIQKQQLRDLTDDPAIAAAKTPEELKAVLPEMP